MVKQTKSDTYLINSKYFGEEPTYSETNNIDSVDYNWYHYMCSLNEAKEYLNTYYNSIGDIKTAKLIAKIADNRFPTQAAWIARAVSLGAGLNKSTYDHMCKLVQGAIETIGKKDDFSAAFDDDKEEIVKPARNIQVSIKDKVSEFIGMFEEAIDQDGYTVSMYSWLQQYSIQPLLVKKIIQYFKPIADEATLLIRNGNIDPQLIEGYNHLSKPKQRERSVFYNQIIQDCIRYSSNTKKDKIVDKIKTKPKMTAKKLDLFTYQKTSAEYKLSSISPEKIFGANKIVLVNTKYKIITLLTAKDTTGLSVHRSAISNFDETKSFSKRMGNKLPNIVENILTSKKDVGGITGKLTDIGKIANRSNVDTILLKVV